MTDNIEEAARVLCAADPFNGILTWGAAHNDDRNFYRTLACALDDADLLTTPEPEPSWEGAESFNAVAERMLQRAGDLANELLSPQKAEQFLQALGLSFFTEVGFTREDLDMNEIRRSAADWVESTIDVALTEEQKEMLLQVFYEAIDGSPVYCLRYAQNGYRRSTSSGSVNVLFSVARDMAENGYAAPIDIADYEGTVLHSGSDFY